ncbi:hypothetical protein V6Z12_D03G070800 [Gossypium hirsutum]
MTVLFIALSVALSTIFFVPFSCKNKTRPETMKRITEGRYIKRNNEKPKAESWRKKCNSSFSLEL